MNAFARTLQSPLVKGVLTQVRSTSLPALHLFCSTFDLKVKPSILPPQANGTNHYGFAVALAAITMFGGHSSNAADCAGSLLRIDNTWDLLLIIGGRPKQKVANLGARENYIL